MRVGLVRNVGLSIIALAVVGLGACDDNPLNFDVKDSTGIFVNPSVMVVPAGRTAQLESRAINAGGEPTFDAVAAAVDASCGAGAITVTPDPEAVAVQPPGLFVVDAGDVLGQTCINLTSGSNSATVEVTVVTDAIEIVSAPDVLRAGETGLVVAQLIDADGNPAGPYDPADAAFASSDEDVATFTDEVGNFSTDNAGAAVLSVTWAGQEANGTSGIGVIRSVDHSLEVLANVPASAAFATTIPGLGAGEEATVEVLVLDALGNQNANPDEVTGCAAVSATPLVATAVCEVVAGTEVTDPVTVEVTVTAVGPGTSAISGTVQTSEGPLAFGPSTATVIAPSVTGLSAASGGFAETVTITGVGLAADGFLTSVLVDGSQLGNFTVVSDTEITAQMPTYAVAGTGHLVVVEVAGIASTESITWDQTNDCSALDFPEEPGFDGPFVDVSIPLTCTGTASGPQDDWFFADISADAAAAGGGEVSVTLTPTWGPPLKDIDFYYDDCSFSVFEFAVDQPPSTFTTDLAEGCSLWIMDDFAGFAGDNTPQPYQINVEID